MWYKFRQVLIENYPNIPYASDTMVAYSNMIQDDESTLQYLIKTKVLLKCINHISKLSQICGKGLSKLAIVQGLRDTTSDKGC